MKKKEQNGFLRKIRKKFFCFVLSFFCFLLLFFLFSFLFHFCLLFVFLFSFLCSFLLSVSFSFSEKSTNCHHNSSLSPPRNSQYRLVIKNIPRKRRKTKKEKTQIKTKTLFYSSFSLLIFLFKFFSLTFLSPPRNSQYRSIIKNIPINRRKKKTRTKPKIKTKTLFYSFFSSSFKLTSSLSPPRNSQYRLIIKNIPRGCTWQDLKDHFRKVGDVCFADVRSKCKK